MAQVVDQAARDRISRDLDETLFVEAGAGTGKTTALVGRIVNLIASGDVRADQIAAITFTEKAAAELYDRVLEQLDAERRRGGLNPNQQQRLAQAAEDLDAAAIETLHAFAGRILRMHPIDAGLPPGFVIIDESEASLKFAERWSQALDELLEDAQLGGHLLNAFEAGLTLNHLRELARALHNDWDRAEAEAAELDSETVDVSGFIRRLDRAIALQSFCSSIDDKLYQRLEQLKPYAHQLRARAAEPGRLVGLLCEPTASLKVGNVGQKRNWRDDGLAEVRGILTGLEERREELAHRIALTFLAPIHNRIRAFVLDYADERRRRGELEFQDLLVRASDLLEQHPSVAQAVGRRFQRLLIDEFQDNDPLQTRIADAIAGGEPGRLFFVGDPKQSIYRFRRADIRQFNAVKQQREIKQVRLSQNFRSTPGVIEFVNAVFKPLMIQGSVEQAEWDDLHAQRLPLDSAQPAVTVVGEASYGSVVDIRRLEADGLARLIADITASGWPVFDKTIGTDGGARPARFADTAVLVPTRTGLVHLLPELEERGIPYRLESRSLVYNQREVRELLSLLRAIDDPTDQIALVAALKSPAFACADDDLARWKRARGTWDYREPTPAGVSEDDPVAESMRWLRGISGRRWTMSVSELVGSVIRERRLLELAVVEWQPREHWQRYRFVLDQARAFNDRGGATLADFLQWAQHQAEEDARVIESVVPETDHDAVRIMTIHAAKGLEFPIVVFAGLNIRRNTLPPCLLWREDGRPEIHLDTKLRTPGYPELRDEHDRLEGHEEVRRNYVGATRARDYLIVSLYRAETKQIAQTAAHAIADVLDEAGTSVRYRRLSHAEIADPPLPSPADRRGGPSDAVDAAQRAAWLERRVAAIQRYASPPRASATEIAKRADRRIAADGGGFWTDPNEVRDDLPPWRRGRAATAIGRATHGALQVIDPQRWTPESATAAAEAQAAAESLNRTQSREVSQLVNVALTSEIMADVRRARRHWRELYAAVEVDGVLLDGYIDLLFETAAGELVVVDYKTDALEAGEAVDAAVQRYRLQVAAYALALEHALQRPVSRCVLLFLHPNEARDVPDLRGAVAEARRLLLTTEHPQAAQA